MLNKLITRKSYIKNNLIILIIIIYVFFVKEDEKSYLDKVKPNGNDIHKVKVYQMKNLFRANIKMKTILIFEPNHYHYECSPGYAKYFVDLGFHVDILMGKSGIDSFFYFEKKDKIRLFLHKGLKQISSYSKKLSSRFHSYTSIIIQTISSKTFRVISKLNLMKIRNVIYIFHYTKYYKLLRFSKIKNQNRIWTLGHFSIGLQVIPFYVGNFKLKKKNKKTRFFIVSTVSRNYNYLVSASEKLKDENFDFEVVVVGKVHRFSYKNINEKIKDNFIFNYRVSYERLFNIVYSSDFIIISLDPNNEKDKIFKNKKVTGAAQLSLGFIKPALINEYFCENYGMSKENSLIFDETNFYKVMKDAILLNNQKYKKMQMNLIELAEKAKQKSIMNVKETFKSLSIHL